MKRRGERNHFSLATGLYYVVEVEADLTGQRVQEVSTSLTSSSSLPLHPLEVEGTSKSRAEGERRAREIKVEDRGRRRRDRRDGGRGEKPCGGV